MHQDKPPTADSLSSETAERILGSSSSETLRDDANDSSAFLTGVNLERERRGSQSHDQAPEPGALENKASVLASVPVAGPRVLDLFDQLNTLAATLPERVADLVQRHEHDFMLSYKSHMSTVQKSFRELKVKADKEGDKVRRDKRVQELEKELKWFMSEALRLDALCKDYRKEVGTWQARSEALSEDKRYLGDQMKASKRQAKVLKAVLKRTRASDLSGEPAAGQGDASGGALLQGPRISVRENATADIPLSHVEDVTAERSGMSMVEAASKVSPLEAEYLTKIGELERELRDLRRTHDMLEEAASQRYVRQAELEDYFLACVDEARKDASRRRYSGYGLKQASPRNTQQDVLDSLVSSEE
ncbi:hypothetical protein FOZ62_031183, partial [Perkinsus olseni]